MLRDRAQLLANMKTGREQVLDARSRGRFEGRDPEPRAELRGGHIPGSLTLPFTELFDPRDKTLIPAAELSARFEAAGVDMGRPVVTTCGSGVTAAVLALGLHIAGHKNVALYDGSWAHWGLPGDTPLETGPAV
jgi:thiosulfate/3-mercaptopyruvate sulfurtransferase